MVLLVSRAGSVGRSGSELRAGLFRRSLANALVREVDFRCLLMRFRQKPGSVGKQVRVPKL